MYMQIWYMSYVESLIYIIDITDCAGAHKSGLGDDAFKNKTTLVDVIS